MARCAGALKFAIARRARQHAKRMRYPYSVLARVNVRTNAERLMKIFLILVFALAGSLFAQTPSQKHSFTFEDMMKLKRVGAPVPSPDGKWVLFDCVDVDLEANTRISHLWIVPASGGESRPLNPTPNHEERPRFSPDGKRLIWTSKATDPTQIWMCGFDSGGGELVGKPHVVTDLNWRGWRDLVAGRKEYPIRVGSLSRLQS